MDSLASIFFAPGAVGSVANAAKSAASAVARPFADVLSALTAPAESADEQAAEGDAGSTLEDRVAELLQSVLESVGAESGDAASVSYDPETDGVRVETDASWGGDASVDISTNEDIMDALRALAASDQGDKPLELLVEVG